MSPEWISRLVVILAVTVVLSEAISGSNLHDSVTICEKLQSREQDILAMGARKDSSTDDDGHFYILTSGGYLYKLPLSNLVIDWQKENFALTVNQEYIDASKLFDQPDSVFYLDASKGYNRFFFISNNEGKGFLGRMLQIRDIKSTEIHLYPLSGGKEKRAPVNKTQQDVQFLAGWRANCSEVFGYQVKSVDSGVNVAWKYTFKMNDASTIEPVGPHIGDNVNLKFEEKVQIYNGFHIELGEFTYFFVLYNESVTISKISNNEAFTGVEHHDKKTMTLSQFIVCQYPRSQKSKKPTSTATVLTEDDGLIWNQILPFIILSIPGLFLVYWCWVCFTGGSNKKKEKQKRKKGAQAVGSSNASGESGSSGTSLNQSSSTEQNASTPESTVQNPNPRAPREVKSPRKTKSLLQKLSKAVKAKVTSMLGVNKTKVAKGVKKANKPKKKKDKSKVTKGSKIGDTKDAKPKNGGPKNVEPKGGGLKPDQSSSQ